MPAASAVIENEDVFVARIVSGPTTTSSSRNNPPFHAKILDDRLHDESCADQGTDGVDGGDARGRGVGVSAVDLPLAANATKVSPIFTLAWSAAPMRVSNRQTP